MEQTDNSFSLQKAQSGPWPVGSSIRFRFKNQVD